MGDLLAWARVLTTGNQTKYVAVGVRSTHGGIAPAAKRGTCCFQWDWTVLENEIGDKASAPAFSPMKMLMRYSQQRASMLTEQTVQHKLTLAAHEQSLMQMPVLEESDCECDDDWRHVC